MLFGAPGNTFKLFRVLILVVFDTKKMKIVKNRGEIQIFQKKLGIFSKITQNSQKSSKIVQNRCSDTMRDVLPWCEVVGMFLVPNYVKIRVFDYF